MSFWFYLKRVLFFACAINTVLVLLVSAFADMIPSLTKGSFKLANVSFILLFSVLAGIVSLILYVKRLGLFPRIIIHYGLLTILIFLFMVVFGNFGGESGSRSSVIFLAFLLYTVIYAVLAIAISMINRSIAKRNNSQKEEYESQF